MKTCELCKHSYVSDWYEDDRIAAPIFYCKKHKKVCKECCDDFSTYGLKKETEFHCGVEESGGHAYNCNDCPNKCEEYYQWEKEMKR